MSAIGSWEFGITNVYEGFLLRLLEHDSFCETKLPEMKPEMRSNFV